MAYDAEYNVLHVGSRLVVPSVCTLEALDSVIKTQPTLNPETFYGAALVRSPEGEMETLIPMADYLRRLQTDHKQVYAAPDNGESEMERVLARTQNIMRHTMEKISAVSTDKAASFISVTDGRVEYITMPQRALLVARQKGLPDDIVSYHVNGTTPDCRIVPVVGLAYLAAQAVRTESFR